MANAALIKSSPSLVDRFFALLKAEPKVADEITTRPQWISGQRPKVDRPFRRRAYSEAMAWNRPPVSYSPHHPYNLD